MYQDDVIAAIATAVGEAAIGIVRLSGRGAGELASGLVRASLGGHPLGVARLPSHVVRHAYLVDPAGDRLVDEVMVVRMAAPRSYTREEMVEIHTHGGAVATHAALALLLRHGARAAEPGEFTLRAFVNGRLEISQAASVAQVIRARTPAALELALQSLAGRLGEHLDAARRALIAALAWLEASIDFPEDDVPTATPTAELAAADAALAALAARAQAGAAFRDGVLVVLVGRPNVGKSSLMNALLRYDRSIVTPLAGTTRDTIAESITVAGVQVTLTDTAGLTNSVDVVERLGVERSRAALARAGVVLLVVDGSMPLSAADRAIMAEVMVAMGSPAPSAHPVPCIVVVNKADQPAALGAVDLRDLGAMAVVHTSAITGYGLDDLEAALARAITGGQAAAQLDPVLASVRQQAAITRARDHLQAALAALAGGLPADIVAIDVRSSLECLGEITGETVSDAVLNEIFAQFCIGK